MSPVPTLLSASTITAVGAALGLASWLFLLGRTLRDRPWRFEVSLGDSHGTERSLSVVVPAHNEATNLRECLPTLLDQDLGEGELEVIVVDDRSTDETWEVLQEFDCDVLRPVRGEPLPEGWSGKNWAAHQGYQRANHDWVLFTDADVAFGDDVLRAALSRAELDTMTSYLPDVEFREPLSRVMEPALGLMLPVLAPLSRVNDPGRPDVAMAWGGFLLFPRTLYEAIGGHAGVRHRTDDDVALARRVASSEGQVQLNITGSLTHICSRSPSETIRRYRRYWSSGWRNDPGPFAVAALVLALGHVLPITLWLSGSAGSVGTGLVAALLGLSHLTALPAYHDAGVSPFWVLALWPTFLLQLGLASLELPRPDGSGKESAGWPEVSALTVGFLAGAVLAFGVRFLGVLPGLGDAMARRTLVLFGMGTLGATVYGTAVWPRRGTPALYSSPLYRLATGLATILGGGVAGIVVYLAVKAAIAGAVIGVGTPRIRFSAALVIAFAGGLLLVPAVRRLTGLGRTVSDPDRTPEGRP